MSILLNPSIDGLITFMMDPAIYETNCMVIHLFYLSWVMRKPIFEVPTRSNTNPAVQPQKMARGLKFRI